MPKITVNEIDNSRYVSPSKSAPMVVLVPGTASFGPVFTANSPAVSTFVGEDALADFYNMYGINPAYVAGETGVLSSVEGDLSFEYATNLLKSGATIHFYRLNEGKTAQNTDGTIVAKYSGRFGNHLAVQIDKVKSTDKDVVISIFRTNGSLEYTSNYDANKIDTTKLIALSKTRVSVDVNSSYFADVVDLKFVKISSESLSTLMAKMGDKDSIVEFLFGGLDFGTETEPDSPMTNVKSALVDSYTSFVDPYLYDFDFVVSGGIVLSDKDNEAIHTAMKNICCTRKDCEAILDTPLTFTHSEVVEYAAKEEFNTSYCAFYAPWATITSSTTGKNFIAPPSLVFLKAILHGMQSQTESELWYVPAGVSRASAPFIVKPEYEIGSVILDEFQNNNPYRVNPIMKLRNYGYCIYGNATALHAEPGLPHSALESMNVRLISNVIKKYIFEVCSGLSFDYNNSTLWLKFYSQMDEKLLYMKRHYGLYDYKIQMDSSTVTAQAQNERRVPGKILISPTLAGEYFDIDFEIAPSGVSFTSEGE